MPRLEDLPTWTVAAVVDRVGSTDRAPGGGAAGGIVIALAAACALKAVLMTLKHHPEDTDLQPAAARLRDIAEEALRGGTDDAVTFARLILAYQMPHDTDDAAEVRRSAIRQEAAGTVEIATRLDRLAREIMAITEPLRPRVSANMESDVAAAFTLARAGEQIQADNIAQGRKAVG